MQRRLSALTPRGPERCRKRADGALPWGCWRADVRSEAGVGGKGHCAISGPSRLKQTNSGWHLG